MNSDLRNPNAFHCSWVSNLVICWLCLLVKMIYNPVIAVLSRGIRTFQRIFCFPNGGKIDRELACPAPGSHSTFLGSAPQCLSGIHWLPLLSVLPIQAVAKLYSCSDELWRAPSEANISTSEQAFCFPADHIMSIFISQSGSTKWRHSHLLGKSGKCCFVQVHNSFYS